MSCAHSFDEWCPECIDGMVQQYNAVRAERDQLREALQDIRELYLAAVDYRKGDAAAKPIPQLLYVIEKAELGCAKP